MLSCPPHMINLDTWSSSHKRCSGEDTRLFVVYRMWTSKQLHIVKQIVLEEGTVLPTQDLIAVFGTRR
jgi:hypothetical protein